MDGNYSPEDLERLASASWLSHLCQHAALMTKYDRRLTGAERRLVQSAQHYLEIAIKNDDYRKEHEQ